MSNSTSIEYKDIRNPDVWGKYYWDFLFIVFICNESPEKLIPVLVDLLPCDECKENFSKYIKKNPLPEGHYERIYWIRELNNNIKKRKGKKEWTFEEFLTYTAKKYV